MSDTSRTIIVPLVVPLEEEILDKNLDLSNSPLNACYSKSVLNGKKRSWWEVRLTIDGEGNLPSKRINSI